MYWYVFNDQHAISGVKEWSALSKQTHERHSSQGNLINSARLPRSILTVHGANNQSRTPILTAATPASTGM
jgi:hypothetical protein